jgi:hypothetical protein
MRLCSLDDLGVQQQQLLTKVWMPLPSLLLQPSVDVDDRATLPHLCCVLGVVSIAITKYLFNNLPFVYVSRGTRTATHVYI